MNEALITKYRPKKLSEVVGQDSVTRSLKGVVEKHSAHSFLFSGPPGVGKTTLARIVAELLGCQSTEIVEVDGATTSGIDDMRSVAELQRYRPLGGSQSRAVIVDECHAISKQAWQSLLKAIEEPSEWCFWFFCTTEITKVPKSIQTRCAHYALKPVASSVLSELLDGIVEAEDLRVTSNIVDLCAREAEGSPRQALTNLAICAEAKSLPDAQELLRASTEANEAVELARLLVQGGSWKAVQGLLNGLQEINPEAIRHTVRAYVTKVVLGAKNEASAGYGVEILDAFSEPFLASEGMSPLIIACARVCLK